MHTLRNLSDISEITNIKRKRIAQSYRAIVKQLDMKMPVVNQVDYVLKISNTLKTSIGTKNLALKILKAVKDLDHIREAIRWKLRKITGIETTLTLVEYRS